MLFQRIVLVHNLQFKAIVYGILQPFPCWFGVTIVVALYVLPFAKVAIIVILKLL